MYIAIILTLSLLSTGAVKAVIVKKFDLPTNKDTRLWHQFMNDSCVEVKGV